MPGNIVFALSLCRKAGALVTGFDAVKDSVFKGSAQLVLCAGDLSEGTRRRVGYFCEAQGVPLYALAETQAALAPICKKPAGVFAVTDPELAKLCKKNLPPPDGGPDSKRAADALADYKKLSKNKADAQDESKFCIR
jgi:ribosomal protein L30E